MRILGLDVGDRRIGVAISDPAQTMAVPKTTLARADGSKPLARLAAEEEIGLVVVGLPLSMSGEEGEQAQETRAYAAALQAELGIPVEFWDERLSSVAAERLLGGGRARVKERVDALAATLILQAFLDSRREPQVDL